MAKKKKKPSFTRKILLLMNKKNLIYGEEKSRQILCMERTVTWSRNTVRRRTGQEQVRSNGNVDPKKTIKS